MKYLYRCPTCQDERLYEQSIHDQPKRYLHVPHGDCVSAVLQRVFETPSMNLGYSEVKHGDLQRYLGPGFYEDAKKTDPKTLPRVGG